MQTRKFENNTELFFSKYFLKSIMFYDIKQLHKAIIVQGINKENDSLIIAKIFVDDKYSYELFENEKNVYGLQDHSNILIPIDILTNVDIDIDIDVNIDIKNVENKSIKIKEKNCNIVITEKCKTDLFDLISIIKPANFKNEQILFDHWEVFVRTQFHHLVNGLIFLHENDIVHLDIKIENIYIDNKYNLKFADFDLSQKNIVGNNKLKKIGTRDYMSPEMESGKCNDFVKADIYSLGITLFVMMFGYFPYGSGSGHKYFKDSLLYKPKFFFETYTNFCGISINISPEFQDLFCCMTKINPIDRITLNEIKNHSWFKQNIYTDEELFTFMKITFENEDITKLYNEQIKKC